MKALPWLISVTTHGLVLLIGGLSLQQAIVGIAPGRNSIEVNLVAGPSESVSSSTTSAPPQPDEPVLPPLQPLLPSVAEITLPPPTADPIRLPDVVPVMSPPTATDFSTTPTEQTTPSHAKAKTSNEHSQRLTPNTGKSAVTAQSIAGAIIDEEPDYLSNPAPIYPQAARDQEQEGLVTLDVIVGTDGSVETIKVSSGSGYHLLDEAARAAVEHYRFRPAMFSGIKVRSHVQVPIRFRLDE